MTDRSAQSAPPTPSTPPTAPSAPSPSVVILRATKQEAVGALKRVAGLTVIERAIRQLGRAVALRVIVVADGTVAIPRNLPPNVEVRPPTADTDTDGAVVALAREMGTGGIIMGADVVRRQRDTLTDGIRVIDEPTRIRAEDEIFAELLRGDLGFIARHINKKISFRITRHVLCKLPVTPNQVTLGAAVVGLIGCLFVATGRYGAGVAGFVLVQAQSVLDGCDGELARVRFQQTEIGEWLDTLVDDFLNLALVASMGIGLSRAGHGWLGAAASAIICGMLLFYNVVSYRELVRQGVGGELLKIRWKFARGIDVKALMSGKSSDGGNGMMRALFRAFLAMGRRDFFIFSWLALAVLDLRPLALFWALLIALSCFGTALNQVVARDEPEVS